MCPYGFFLCLTINAMWLATSDMPARREAAPLPAELQSALTAIPERCLWEIPQLGADDPAHQSLWDRRQAWLGRARMVMSDSVVERPVFRGTDGDVDEGTLWELLYCGRVLYSNRFITSPPPKLREIYGWSTTAHRLSFWIVEIGPRPVWLPLSGHARSVTSDVLFSGDEKETKPGIRCRRTIAQTMPSIHRARVSVWVEVDHKRQ